MNRLQLRHVLCPMDLSPLSMNSLEWANAIARARRAELRALHVVVSEGLVAPDTVRRGRARNAGKRRGTPDAELTWSRYRWHSVDDCP